MSGASTGALVALRVVGVGVVVMAVLSLAWPVASSFARARASDGWTEPAITRLEVDVPAGSVELVAEDGPLRLDVERRGTWALPSADLERDGDRAVLTSTCPATVLGDCQVDVVARVPRDADVVVDLSAGSVVAEGLAGDLDVDLSAGEVDLQGLSSQRVLVRLSAGEISTAFTVPPREVDVTTSVGQVTVRVPDDGTAYDVRADTSVGESVIGVPQRTGAPRTVRAATSVGQVLVGVLDPADDTGRPAAGPPGPEAPSPLLATGQ